MEYINSTKLILKLHNHVLPIVDKMVGTWEDRFRRTNVGMLFSLSGQISIQKIKYLNELSILSLYPNIVSTDSLNFSIPFTIISDYLRELIKREGPKDAASLNQLLGSLTDSVDVNSTLGNYYLYHPYINDNGYLQKLVEECRRYIIKNENFFMVAKELKSLVNHYSELQFFKYIREPYRKEMIHVWSVKNNCEYSEIYPFEYFAAADSILGIAALFSYSLSKEITSEEIEKIYSAYFPWICGLHKLLDSYVNAQEDICTSNFNLTNYYKNLKDCEERISFFTLKSLEMCEKLKYSEFHRGVVEYLLSLYLSDPRALSGINKLASMNILKEINPKNKLNFNLCKFFRLAGKIC